MQLPLTSLIPTVVELISFWQANWPSISWFPNWYLGVPFRFVTGPVVPLVVLFFRKLTGLPVESVYIGFIGGIWLIGGFGIKLLVRELGGGKGQQWWSAILFILLPVSLFLLQFGNGLHHLSTALLPWVFVFSYRSFWGGSANWRSVQNLLLIVSSTILLLINHAALLPLLIGLTVLVLTRSQTEWVKGLVKTALVILTSISLATIWYTPRFWWILLGNPSFGGKPLSNVIPLVLQLAQALLPIILGVWFVQKRYTLKHKLMQFGVLFGSSFLFLTVIRFLSDVDFWMDWTGFGLELQLTGAIVGGVFLTRWQVHYSSSERSESRSYLKESSRLRSNNIRQIVTFFIILTLTISDGYLVKKNFFDSESDKYRKQILSLSFRSGLAGEKSPPESETPNGISQSFTLLRNDSSRIFLTGSPVFWLSTKQNSYILQVRGGRDEVSTHKTWAIGAYQIREGETDELLKNWLTVFGVSQLLYQGPDSQEYFKDYKNRERFVELNKQSFPSLCHSRENGNPLVITKTDPRVGHEDDGTRDSCADLVYVFPYSIARSADKALLNVDQPEKGNDEQALASYVDKLGAPLEFTYKNPTTIQINGQIDSSQIISLAVSYDPNWHLVKGAGKITSDSFGNLVILPQNKETEWTLEYREGWSSWLPAVLLSLISTLLLSQSDRLTQLLLRKSPSLSTADKNEEEEY